MFPKSAFIAINDEFCQFRHVIARHGEWVTIVPEVKISGVLTRVVHQSRVRYIAA